MPKIRRDPTDIYGASAEEEPPRALKSRLLHLQIHLQNQLQEEEETQASSIKDIRMAIIMVAIRGRLARTVPLILLAVVMAITAATAAATAIISISTAII